MIPRRIAAGYRHLLINASIDCTGTGIAKKTATTTTTRVTGTWADMLTGKSAHLAQTNLLQHEESKQEIAKELARKRAGMGRQQVV